MTRRCFLERFGGVAAVLAGVVGVKRAGGRTSGKKHGILGDIADCPSPHWKMKIYQTPFGTLEYIEYPLFRDQK